MRPAGHRLARVRRLRRWRRSGPQRTARDRLGLGQNARSRSADLTAVPGCERARCEVRRNARISGVARRLLLPARRRMGRRMTGRGDVMDLWYALAIRETRDLNEEVNGLLEEAEAALRIVPPDEADEEDE